MKVALLFSSKTGMEATLFRRPDERRDEEDEPPQPVDLLAECDSDETIAAVGQALQERHQVVFIESDEKAYARLKRQRPQLVFNIAERVVGPNRESHIPTVCEMLDIPYTGSDPLTLGVCLDKSRAKEILSYHRIPNPGFWIVETPSGIPAGVRLPAIVKPLTEGSSKGIKNNSLVRSLGDLYERVDEITTTYKQPVIVERFLAGREFTVGVLGNTPTTRSCRSWRSTHRPASLRGGPDLLLRRRSGSRDRPEIRCWTSSGARPRVPDAQGQDRKRRHAHVRRAQRDIRD